MCDAVASPALYIIQRVISVDFNLRLLAFSTFDGFSGDAFLNMIFSLGKNGDEIRIMLDDAGAKVRSYTFEIGYKKLIRVNSAQIINCVKAFMPVSA